MVQTIITQPSIKIFLQDLPCMFRDFFEFVFRDLTVLHIVRPDSEYLQRHFTAGIREHTGIFCTACRRFCAVGRVVDHCILCIGMQDDAIALDDRIRIFIFRDLISREFISGFIQEGNCRLLHLVLVLDCNRQSRFQVAVMCRDCNGDRFISCYRNRGHSTGRTGAVCNDLDL